MKRTLFYSSLLVLVLFGCRQQEPESQLLVMNQGLENCNGILQDEIKVLHQAMEDRLKDPLSHDYAVIWEPRFIRIQKNSDSIRLYIDSLKEQIIKQSDSLKESNAAIVTALYEQKGIGNELLKKLSAFKMGVPAYIREEIGKDSFTNQDFVNREIDRICKNSPLLSGYTDSLNESQRDLYARKWVEENFEGSTPVVVIGVLNKIENDILITSKEFLDYCFNNTEYRGCGYRTEFSLMASLNSSFVKRGQQIEVTAALWAHYLTKEPRLTINGREIELKDKTAALHQFIATGKPGKHYVTVKLWYERPDSTVMEVNKKLEYIIAE